MGYHAAKFLSEEDGSRVVGIIEWDGALYNPDGIDVEAVRQWIVKHGGVKDYPDATHSAEGGAVLESECDILIPAPAGRCHTINKGHLHRGLHFL